MTDPPNLRPVPERPDFDVEREERDGTVVLHASGELDLASKGLLEDTVTAALAAGPVLVDLGGVRFLDSTGVRVLDELTRAAEAGGQDLRFASRLHPHVRQVLLMTGLAEVLPFTS